MKKAQRNFQQQFGQQKRQSPPKKEGEVSVDYVPGKERKSNGSNVGEYVDFEEVDD